MSLKLAASYWSALSRASPKPLSRNTTTLLSLRAFTTTSRFRRRSTNPTIPNTRIKIFHDIPSLRQWRRSQLLAHRTVGLVPTMGALHSGHLSLIRLAAQQNSHVVVSIYVNPTQFGISEDLSSYPVTWDADLALLRDLDRDLASDGSNLGSISAVFAPSTSVIYPSGPPDQALNAKGSFITITPVGELLEGASRPTFFRGVATVCMKLFNIVTPERVYFGQKDIQQTVVIKKMVRDFHVDTEVVIGPTEREADGLALSSRNVYLGTRRRAVAPALKKILHVAEQGYLHGKRSREEILGPALELAKLLLLEQYQLQPSERCKFEVDYLSLSDPESMEEVGEVEDAKGAILSGAIKMLPVEEPQPDEDLGQAGGPSVRLIDNVVLQPTKL